MSQLAGKFLHSNSADKTIRTVLFPARPAIFRKLTAGSRMTIYGRPRAMPASLRKGCLRRRETAPSLQIHAENLLPFLPSSPASTPGQSFFAKTAVWVSADRGETDERLLRFGQRHERLMPIDTSGRSPSQGSFSPGTISRSAPDLLGRCRTGLEQLLNQAAEFHEPIVVRGFSKISLDHELAHLVAILF